MDVGNTKHTEKLDVKVKFLDEHVDIFTVNMNSLGSELFQKVSIRIKLLENYFFGLSFESPELDLCWLDLRKTIRKQYNVNNEYVYDFCIKFYSPDPNMLQDSLTKQLLILQLKKDLSKGELICCDSTRILLGAFFLQLQYPGSVEHDRSILRDFLRLLFNDLSSSSTVLIQRSLDFYDTLKEQSEEETQFDLLETVRKIEYYGMKMHPAKDIEGVSLNLAVYHMGIVIFQKCTKINIFNWSRIRKLSFKRKRFLIKLHSEEYLELFILWVVQGFYKDTLEFYFDSRNSCKNFWKKCIEHHSFFRSQSSESFSSSRLDRIHGLGRNFSGSRFRYVGPTQNELEQIRRRHSQGIINNFIRSESAGRLMARDISLPRLSRASYSSNYNSNNCLSYTTEPSSSDNIGQHNINQLKTSIPNSFVNFPWNKLGIGNDDYKFDVELLKDSNYIFKLLQSNTIENSQFSQTPICSGGLNSINDIQSTLAKERNQSSSLETTRDIKSDGENHSLSNSLPNDDFSSFEFIPKLLAQALTSDECSYEYPMFGVDHSGHGDGSTNNGSSSRSFVSTSINSDNATCISTLTSVIKDFLFNEFTHVKEMEVLSEMLDRDTPVASKLFSLLDSLISATNILIAQLEESVQLNTQSSDSYQTSANHFFGVLDEYARQTSEIIKLYLHIVDNFIKCFPDEAPQPICLLSSQLQYLKKSLFHAKNPLRLLLSVVFHQRNRYRCILMIFDFLLIKEEDKSTCKDIIEKLKSSIISVEEVEDLSHQLLLVTSIEGIRKLSPRRFGWLQRISNKGASNRLFILNCQELICVKKFQSNAFIIEQSWRLDDIRVGSISEMTNHTNGFIVTSYPFEFIAIILCFTKEEANESANVVMIADSKRSQSIWINEINDAKRKSKHDFQMSENLNRNIGHDWIQDYQLIDLCWHDRISMSWDQAKFLFQLTLSSYVLRRCKPANSWQRLWMVLSHWHLYFYRRHTDREALTSLSLSGFRVVAPSVNDSINKDWVLKLTKESKSYFLRTENKYFYLRWLTALQYCTSFIS